MVAVLLDRKAARCPDPVPVQRSGGWKKILVLVHVHGELVAVVLGSGLGLSLGCATRP